jgi:hypothetical protein
MDILNHRLDIIGHQLSWQSWESENNPIDKDKLGARANHPTSPVYQRSLKFKNSADIKPPKKFGEAQVNNEIGTKIHELLKKSGKPIPYHDLTENLSKDYPGYNYDFFLEEIEDLQKEGKVEVQLIAGKLYFQIQKT